MSMSAESPTLADPLPPEVQERLHRLDGSGTAHLIVIRSADREMGTALLERIVRERPGPAVVIDATAGPADPSSPGVPPARPQLRFTILPIADEIVSVAAASAVTRFFLALMRDEGEDPMVLPHWVPPRLLKAFSLLPVDPTPTIAIDGWDELIARDLRYRPGSTLPGSTPEQRERTALNAMDDASGVHFVVVVRRPHLNVEAKAELVLEAIDRPEEPPGTTTLRVVDASGASWTVLRPGRDSPLVLSHASVASRCRCGRTIAVGDAVYTVTTHPTLAWAMFHDQQFCSPRCVRAFCLESLESLEAIDMPATKAMVSDLREFGRMLAGVFTAIMDE